MLLNTGGGGVHCLYSDSNGVVQIESALAVSKSSVSRSSRKAKNHKSLISKIALFSKKGKFSTVLQTHRYTNTNILLVANFYTKFTCYPQRYY